MIHRLALTWGGAKEGVGRGEKVAYTLSNSARGEMTPQWRLSLKNRKAEKDLGQAGNTAGETVSEGEKNTHLSWESKKLLGVSYEQVAQRRGRGGAFAGETRQERTDAVRFGVVGGWGWRLDLDRHRTHSDSHLVPITPDHFGVPQQ